MVKIKRLTIIPDYGHHVLKITCVEGSYQHIKTFGVIPPETRLLNKSFIEDKLRRKRRVRRRVGKYDDHLHKRRPSVRSHACLLVPYRRNRRHEQEQYRIKLRTWVVIKANNYKLKVSMYTIMSNQNQNPERKLCL
jgi:hypothetical protein